MSLVLSGGSGYKSVILNGGSGYKSVVLSGSSGYESVGLNDSTGYESFVLNGGSGYESVVLNGNSGYKSVVHLVQASMLEKIRQVETRAVTPKPEQRIKLTGKLILQGLEIEQTAPSYISPPVILYDILYKSLWLVTSVKKVLDPFFQTCLKSFSKSQWVS